MDRRLNIMLALSTILAIGGIIFAAYTVPAIIAGSADSRAVRDSQDLATCRAQYSNNVNVAKDARDQAIFDGLVATAIGNELELDRITDEAPVIRERIAQASAAYQSALTLSKDHPMRFLRECRRA